MFLGWFRRFFFPLFPGLFIAWGAYALATHIGRGAIRPLSWLGLLPLILLGTTVLLGTLFRQFRISLIAIPCAAIAWRCLPSHDLAVRTAAVASLLLPVWFTVASFQKERRPFSLTGLTMLTVALALTALLLLATHDASESALKALRALEPIDALRTWWNLPPAGLLLAGSAAPAMLLRRTNRRANVLLLQALLLALVALNADADVFRPLAPHALFACAFTGAAILLLWTVLDGAWQHAFIDELTGLPGRRPLTQHLASLGRHYSVAIVDIDHFKRVNDTHGHDVGDQALRYIAACLKRCRSGAAYRFGGEEFVIVFAGNRFARHVATLEDLRETIAATPFVIRNAARPKKKPRKNRKDLIGVRRRIRLNVSIGVANRTDKRRKPDDVLKAADKALYKAKRGGRNRVCKA